MPRQVISSVDEKMTHSKSSAKEKRGDVYWARAGPESAGIVVVTPWMLSKPTQLTKHSRLFASCNWDSLITHPPLLYLWFPYKATALAFRILDMLVEELEYRPRLVTFAAFSGGVKSCLYKILEILFGDAGDNSSLRKYRIVRDAYAGQILDSCPMDFTSQTGVNFFSHPVVIGNNKRIAGLAWSAHAVAKGLDAMFLPYFEAQRADMWTTLEISWALGPVLVFCSKDDELANFEVILNFCDRMSGVGCNVKLVIWENSTHVAHLMKHPDEYKAAVQSFLSSATALNPSIRTPDLEHPLQTAGGEGGSLVRSSVSMSLTSCRSFPTMASPHVKASARSKSDTSSDHNPKLRIRSRL